MQMKWTPASLFLADPLGSKSSKDEVVPMEVDRVKGKKGEKGSNGNKGKGPKHKPGKGKDSTKPGNADS